MTVFLNDRSCLCTKGLFFLFNHGLKRFETSGINKVSPKS